MKEKDMEWRTTEEENADFISMLMESVSSSELGSPLSLSQEPEPMPTKVKVGPHEVDIISVSDGVLGDAGRHGQCSISRLIIAVDAELPATQRAETVLHEINHIMLSSIGIDDESLVERLALRFGVDVLALIRDNPKLILWLLSL